MASTGLVPSRARMCYKAATIRAKQIGRQFATTRSGLNGSDSRCDSARLRRTEFHTTMAFSLRMRGTASSLLHELLLSEGEVKPNQRKMVRPLRTSRQIVRL